MICIQRHDVVRSSANQVGCLRGLGATTNKSTGGSCLDTDIACQFVFGTNIQKFKEYLSEFKYPSMLSMPIKRNNVIVTKNNHRFAGGKDMSQRALFEKMHILYGSEDADRVEWKSSDDSNITVSVDVHQMTCSEAKRFIKNIISLFAQCDFTLNVIHGYVHGTAIKEMICRDSISQRIEKITSPANNPGVSVLMIASM